MIINIFKSIEAVCTLSLDANRMEEISTEGVLCFSDLVCGFTNKTMVEAGVPCGNHTASLDNTFGGYGGDGGYWYDYFDSSWSSLNFGWSSSYSSSWYSDWSSSYSSSWYSDWSSSSWWNSGWSSSDWDSYWTTYNWDSSSTYDWSNYDWDNYWSNYWSNYNWDSPTWSSSDWDNYWSNQWSNWDSSNLGGPEYVKYFRSLLYR